MPNKNAKNPFADDLDDGTAAAMSADDDIAPEDDYLDDFSPENMPLERIVPEGEYTCVVLSGEVSYTKNGNKQLALALRIIEPEEWADEKLYHRLYFTDKTRRRSFNQLAIIRGRPIPEGRWGSAEQLYELNGKVVKVKVKHEEYQDRMQARVDTVMPAQRTAKALF